MTSPLKSWASVAQILCGAILGWENKKVAKMVVVH